MNDYDDQFYIDEEPQAGSGDEDTDEAREYQAEQDRKLRKRIEESIFLSKQAM